MADFMNLLQSATSLFGIHAGARIQAQSHLANAQRQLAAGEIAASGALLTAQGYRVSKDSLDAAVGFNLAIDEINEYRRLQDMSRQFQRVQGRQLSAQAVSGLKVTSKSFMQVQSETRDIFENQFKNIKIDAENTRRAKVFEAEIQKTNLENQARASEYRAQVARTSAANAAAASQYQAEVAQFRATQKTIAAVPTLLSEVFGKV